MSQSYETFHLTSGVGSAAPVAVYPDWGFTEREERHREHGTSLGGRLLTHRLPGAQLRFDLPLTHISSATAAELRGWWLDQRELALTFNLSGTAESALCRIANEAEPFGGHVPARRDLFSGMLFLHEVGGGGKAAGGPFILDDATWGLLDQDYNVLT